MWSHVRTIWMVFLHAFRRRVTVQYPEEKRPLPARWRGRIILSRDPDGEEVPVFAHQHDEFLENRQV